MLHNFPECVTLSHSLQATGRTKCRIDTGAHESTPARTNWHRAETRRGRVTAETCLFKTHYTNHHRHQFMPTATATSHDTGQQTSPREHSGPLSLG